MMQFSGCFLARRLVSCSALLVSPLIVFCSTALAQQSDAVGLSLLFPPSRAVVRRFLAQRFRASIITGPGSGPDGVIIDP